MSVKPGAALRKDMLAEMAADVETLPRETGRATEMASNLQEHVGGFAGEAQERLRRVSRRSGRKVVRQRLEVVRQVLRRPIHTLLIAGATGFVVGLVTNQ